MKNKNQMTLSDKIFSEVNWVKMSHTCIKQRRKKNAVNTSHITVSILSQWKKKAHKDHQWKWYRSCFGHQILPKGDDENNNTTHIHTKKNVKRANDHRMCFYAAIAASTSCKKKCIKECIWRARVYAYDYTGPFVTLHNNHYKSVVNHFVNDFLFRCISNKSIYTHKYIQ